MTCGIYILRFKGTDKVYIGQSVSITDRFYAHTYGMRSGTSSKKLNEAAKQYGLPTMEILLECPKEELNANENEAIEIFNSIANGFNECSKAEDMPFPDNRGELSGNALYSNAKIEEVFHYLVDSPILTQSEISSITGVSVSAINSVACGARHKWLQEVYPDKYTKLLELKGTRKTAKGRGIIHPTIVSPTGEQFVLENVRDFCRQYDLDQGHIGKVLKGVRLSHKGWKLQSVRIDSIP